MKAATAKIKKRVTTDARTSGILASLRDARKSAVKTARLHKTTVVYLRGGKLVKARS
jgi:hypothetical protein